MAYPVVMLRVPPTGDRFTSFRRPQCDQDWQCKPNDWSCRGCPRSRPYATRPCRSRCNNTHDFPMRMFAGRDTGSYPMDFSEIESVLHNILAPLFHTREADTKKAPNDEPKTQRPKPRDWCETVELPSGFTVRNLEDIQVSDNKVLIKLVKATRDFSGIHSIKAIRAVHLPADVIQDTLKVMLVGSNKVRVLATLKPNESDRGDAQDDTQKPKAEDKTAEKAKADEDSAPLMDDQSTERSDEVPSKTAEDAMEHLGESSTVSAAEEFIVINSEDIMTDSDCDCSPCEQACAIDCSCECKDDTTLSEEENIDDRADEGTEASGSNRSSATDEIESDANTSELEPTAAKEPQDNAPEEDETSTLGSTDAKEQPSVGQPEEFRQVLTVEPFDIKDITLKLSGNELYIDAEHKEEDEGNLTSFQMHRSVTIPAGVNLDKLISRVTEEGKLVISAPYLAKRDTPEERVLTIEH